jgi:hypothetical protein
MALPGKSVAVYIGANQIMQINDCTFTINNELVDITAFEDAAFRRRLSNLVDASISLAGFYKSDDTTGQNLLRTSALTGSLITSFKVLADSAVPTSGFTCNAYVESFEIAPAVEGAVPVSISMLSDGTISVSS